MRTCALTSMPGRFAVLAVLALAGTTAQAQASSDSSGGTDPIAKLTGFKETPSIITTGSATLELSVGSSSISYVLTFANLEAPATEAHIHIGQPGVAGGVAAFLCGGGGKSACPPGGGTVTGTITAADVIGPTAQGIQPGQLDRLIIAIRAGVAYTNVHSTLHPEGEIRGQIEY